MMAAAAMGAPTGQMGEMAGAQQNDLEQLDTIAHHKVDMNVCEQDQNCMRHVRIANIIRLQFESTQL